MSSMSLKSFRRRECTKVNSTHLALARSSFSRIRSRFLRSDQEIDVSDDPWSMASPSTVCDTWIGPPKWSAHLTRFAVFLELGSEERNMSYVSTASKSSKNNETVSVGVTYPFCRVVHHSIVHPRFRSWPSKRSDCQLSEAISSPQRRL